MQTDCEAFGHDWTIKNAVITNANIPKPWHLPDAKELLKKDVAKGKHLTTLWKSENPGLLAF